MTPLSRALDLLEAQDARVAAAPQESLCPGRARPTPLRALGLALLPPDVDPARALAWAQGLVEVAQAQREHFPDTIFWDQDLLAASLLRLPSLDALRQVAADIRALQAQFGRRSELCFRYTHDFNYGYDWSRWVAREPARAQVGPFDPPFLAYMKQRGGELVELIAADDANPLPALRATLPRKRERVGEQCPLLPSPACGGGSARQRRGGGARRRVRRRCPRGPRG
jgi:hypothetical protein